MLRHLRFNTLDSTNQEAKRYIAHITRPHLGMGSKIAEMVNPDDLNEGIVITAETQTGGRGQHARTWWSGSPDGIYYTYLARWDIPLAATVDLSVCIGQRIGRRLCDMTGLNIKVKSPNDLMLQSKKLGGILIENTAVGKTVKYGIIGVGLNINHASFPPEIESIAISLYQASGKRWDKEAITNALTKEIQLWQSEVCGAQPSQPLIQPMQS